MTSAVRTDAGADHRGGRRQSVEEARARGVHVHRRRVVRADQHLHARGAVGDLLVVAAAAVDDQVDILGVHAGAGQRALARDRRHLDRRDVRHAPLLHAGAARDPGVVRLEERREIGVGQHGRRHALAPTGDGGVGHLVCPLSLGIRAHSWRIRRALSQKVRSRAPSNDRQPCASAGALSAGNRLRVRAALQWEGPPGCLVRWSLWLVSPARRPRCGAPRLRATRRRAPGAPRRFMRARSFRMIVRALARRALRLTDSLGPLYPPTGRARRQSRAARGTPHHGRRAARCRCEFVSTGPSTGG